jgi:hypothetical protein
MSINGFIRFLFYSNLFYAFCLFSLLLQTAIVLPLPIPTRFYFLLCGTVLLFYTHAYYSSTSPSHNNDERLSWYQKYHSRLFISQLLLTLLLLISAIPLLPSLFHRLLPPSIPSSWPALLFPLLALLYYGGIQPGHSRLNLRQYGWLKPIIIALVWSGTSIFIPLWWMQTPSRALLPNTATLLLFFQQTFFLAAISILFDIKDFNADHNQELKTWAVRIGPELLLQRLIMPLSLLGCLLELIPIHLTGYPPIACVLNCIPWVLLIFACRSLNRNTPILHYLWLIDGLIPAKAGIGIFAHLLTH